MSIVKVDYGDVGGGDNTFIESFIFYRIPNGWYASVTDENYPSGRESNVSYESEYLNITTSGTFFVITIKKKCRIFYKETTGSYPIGGRDFNVGDTISLNKQLGTSYEFAFIGVYA